MIELSNTSAVTLQPGASMTFDRVIVNTGNCTCYRPGTNSIGMRYRGIYDVRFSANVTGATAASPVSLAIAIGNAVLSETIMIYTPATANAVGNVSRSTYIPNCCDDFSRITVVNNGTTPVIVSANSMLSVRKMC